MGDGAKPNGPPTAPILDSTVTPADADERAEVGRLTHTVQAVTGESVKVGFVDQGYNGPNAASAAMTTASS